MAHELYTRTNQKIYFAGLALAQLAQAERGGAMNAAALQQAGREAVLFHLYGALLGLCHEIAGFYHLPDTRAPRAEAYLNEQVLAQAANPELAELVELLQSRDSWLVRLLAAYNALYEPPRAPREIKRDVTTPLIAAVNLDEPEPEPELDGAALEQWRQHLKQLAVRFRDGLSEC